MSELPKRTPMEYDVNGNLVPGVTEQYLGMNADHTISKLPAFIDFDGIQVEPSRINLSNTLRLNVDLGEKR